MALSCNITNLRNTALSEYGTLSAVTKARPRPCDEMLAFLAKTYYVTEGEIALRWCIDQGVAAITTSGKGEKLCDHLRAMTLTLTPEEVKDLAEIGTEKHYRGFW